jgi:hypothetical protein
MSARTKGRRSEMKAKEILEAAGYEVELTKMPSKFSKQQDLFGLWDIMAKNDVSIRFIQVKTNRMIYGMDLEPYKLWKVPVCCTKEVWVFYDREKEPLIKIL